MRMERWDATSGELKWLCWCRNYLCDHPSIISMDHPGQWRGRKSGQKNRKALLEPQKTLRDQADCEKITTTTATTTPILCFRFYSLTPSKASVATKLPRHGDVVVKNGAAGVGDKLSDAVLLMRLNISLRTGRVTNDGSGKVIAGYNLWYTMFSFTFRERYFMNHFIINWSSLLLPNSQVKKPKWTKISNLVIKCIQLLWHCCVLWWYRWQ